MQRTCIETPCQNCTLIDEFAIMELPFQLPGGIEFHIHFTWTERCKLKEMIHSQQDIYPLENHSLDH
jgi:hypothetical protein